MLELHHAQPCEVVMILLLRHEHLQMKHWASDPQAQATKDILRSLKEETDNRSMSGHARSLWRACVSGTAVAPLLAILSTAPSNRVDHMVSVFTKREYERVERERELLKEVCLCP